jgi:hypothetical protein
VILVTTLTTSPLYTQIRIGLNLSFDFYSNLSEEIIISITDAEGKRFTIKFSGFMKSLDTYALHWIKISKVYILNIYTSQKTQNKVSKSAIKNSRLAPLTILLFGVYLY